MIIAKIIDKVWATRKADILSGYKFMLAEVLGGTNAGQRLVVIDIISAGIGDRVIITTGSSARKMFHNDDVPVDAVVIGIIDEDCNFG
jgi:ethanolamine utilization protein EutN